MSYYIQCPTNTNKVRQIRELMGGEVTPEPESFAQVPKDWCLVCVVHVYATYDAAMVCGHDERQFNRHFFPGELAASTLPGTHFPDDDRPRTWMMVPKDKVVENLGFDRRVERGPSWVR